MTTNFQKSTPPVMWVAAVALIIFSMVGVAAMMGWIPNSIGEPSAAELRAKAAEANEHKTDHAYKSERAHKSDNPRKEKVYVASNTSNPNPPKVICNECGVVQSTREIVQPGDGGAVGIVGGAVVGGLLGNQVGKGRGKDVATVAGAVGGAVVGNEIEKRVDTTKRYEVAVRFNDGSSRVFTETKPTAWRSGDQVKLVDGVLRAHN